MSKKQNRTEQNRTELLDLFALDWGNHGLSESILFEKLKKKHLILYGAGELGVTFIIRLAKKYRLSISSVLDRKFEHPTMFYEIPAYSPFEYHPTEQEQKESLVIIAVAEQAAQNEIISQLKDVGYDNIMLATDLYELQVLHTPDGLLKNGHKFYLSNRENILNTFDLLTDNLSQEVFNLFLSTHIKRSFIRFPCYSNRKEQYFPSDIRMQKGYEYFINCGAYDGDTIKQLNSAFGKIKALICFEPNLENFQKLSSYLRNYCQEIAEEIFVYPCGVYSTTRQIRFSSAEASSVITKDGTSVIQCVSIDDIIPLFCPTFINMDIEGAELEALKGAEQILKKFKPDLAVCVYHSPDHIWEIPLYLNSLELGYKFYLRTYTYFTNETVLYATT